MSVHQARNDLAKKIRLEALFRAQVRRGMFLEQGIFKSQVVLEGKLIDPEELRLLWFNIVNKQYNRVASEFSTASGLSPIKADILNNNLENFIMQSSLRSSNFISKTSEKHMLIARTEAASFLNANSIPITDKSLSRVGVRVLTRLQSPRSENITITETQSSAEGSKRHTAIAEEKDKKQWFTVSDKLVRPAHVLAHGQVRLIDTPFDVGGEKLKEPGDSSLGASIGNTAFCRCGAIYG